MKILRAKNYEEMSRMGADIIAGQISERPDSVLGLATGSTPIATYANLVRDHKEKGLDFSRLTTVNLDEYKGLSGDNDQSYRYFMNENLFKHVNIDLSRTFLPDGSEPDSAKACADYEEKVKATGGVCLQLLGIGHNGHIGFNEPGDEFKVRTYCTKLTAETIEANKRFFARLEDVPTEAYTMGIGTIMAARKILLLVSGEAKAKIMREALCGEVTPKVPASILQFHHNVTIVGDEAALSLL